MRTMGLTALRADTQAIPSPWMESLCRSVARLWQGEADSRDPVKLSDYARLFDARARADFPPGIGDNMAAEQLADFSLTPEPLIESLREKVGGLAGGDIEAYLGRVISEGLAASPSSDWPAEEAIGRLHAVAGIKEGSEPIPTDRLKSLRELGAREASRRGTETGEALRNRLLQRVDLWEAHVTGARQAADEIAARLDSLETDLRQRLRRAEAERALYLAKLRELRDDSRANRRRLRETVAEHLPGYATAVLGELLLELAVKTVRTIRPFATACSDQLRDLWKDLNRLSEEFAAAGPADDAGDLSAQDPSPAASFFGPLAEVFARHCEAMVGQLDRAIRAGFFAGGRRLSDLSSVDSSVRADLIAQMRSAARKVLLRCVRDANLSRLSEALAGGDTRGLSVFLQSCCDLASPKLLKLSGGAQRLLLAVPESLDASRLGAEVHRLSGDPPTLVPEGWQEPLICYEAESLALDRLSARFLQGRPDCRELASRLHTRVDVSW